MIERKRFLGAFVGGVIGLVAAPFMDIEKERESVWFKLYNYDGDFQRWVQLDVSDWVHKPDLSEGLGYGRYVTEHGEDPAATLIASSTKAPSTLAGTYPLKLS